MRNFCILSCVKGYENSLTPKTLLLPLLVGALAAGCATPSFRGHDASLVRHWCESAEFSMYPELGSKQRIETIPADVARAIERLKESDPGVLAAAFAVLLLRDYALQRAEHPSGFTLEHGVPWTIVEWEAARLGFPDEFPPSAQAQLVTSMMAEAIVRHADELFADDPTGRKFAERTKAQLATCGREDPATQSPAEESRAESAELADPKPDAESL